MEFFAAILNSCLRYHHVGVTNPSRFAPSISGIFDRDLDSDSSFFCYSAGLKISSGNWMKEKIADFIKNPQKSHSSSIMSTSQDLQDYKIDVLANQLKASSSSEL
jgi:cytochrome c2